eukprot:GGOE01006212.1.p1 GENE.GGOE01006212.1~~GGOE01006212.1.p1  ORF type:complete len:431 (-),score=111.91 GGOE01006212.1:878-2170(-)
MGCHHSSSKERKRPNSSGSQRPMIDRQESYTEKEETDKKRPNALEIDDIRELVVNGSSGATSPTSLSPREFHWKPRPPAPPPDCTKQQLQDYLASYSILPLNWTDAEESSGGLSSPTSSSPSSPNRFHPLGRRVTVCDAGFDEDKEAGYQMKVVPKTPQEEAALMEALAKLAIFAHLDDKELQTVVQSMDRATFKQGEVLFHQGESKGDEDKMFVIIEGAVSLTCKGEHSDRGAGDIFGEGELLFPQSRHTTARVETSYVRAWTLSRLDFRHLLRGASMRKRQAYAAVLKKITFLQSLTNAEIVQLCDCLQPVKYRPGEAIIRYGDVGLWMYIILEGKVEVLGRKEDGSSIHVCYFGEGEHVGELEFINKHLTVADVVAVDEVRAARVHRDHFESCMGPIVDLLSKKARVNEKYEYYRSKNPNLRVTFKD